MNKENVSKISREILASTLSGQQREKIVQFMKSDPQMSFQEAAKFLSSKVGATDSIIYSFLMTHDWNLTRSNDYLKRK